MRSVQVYTKEGCQFSAGLKAILESKGVPYEESVVTLDSPEHHEVGAKAGSMKLPQAFVGYIYLGSTHEVQAAAANGMLMDLVAD